AFDDALRGAQFIQQRRFCNAEFHRLMFLACGSCCAHSVPSPLFTAVVLYSLSGNLESPQRAETLWKCVGIQTVPIRATARAQSLFFHNYHHHNEAVANFLKL